MRRRVLDLCLLAYPRARRERDRDYLRDLALELAGTYGLGRQAVSLLRGGLGERIERRRRNRGRKSPVWIRRVVIGGFVGAGMALAVSGPSVGGVHDVESGRLACVDAAGRCARSERLVAARVRAGWDCALRRGDGRLEMTWRCTR